MTGRAPSTSTPAQVIWVSYAHGAVAGDTGRITVPRGATVARLSFPATIPGIFSVELEHRQRRLVELQVP